VHGRGFMIDSATFEITDPATLSSWSHNSTEDDTNLAYTVPAGTDRILIAYWAQERAFPDHLGPTGVTYGGQAMTFIDQVDTTGGWGRRLQAWYILEAGIAAASGNAIQTQGIGTGAGSAVRSFFMAGAYEHVNQTDPIGALDSDFSTSAGNGQISVSLTGTVAGSRLVAGSHNEDSGTPAWTSPLGVQLAVNEASNMGATIADCASPGGTVTVEVTWANAFQDRTLIAFELLGS